MVPTDPPTWADLGILAPAAVTLILGAIGYIVGRRTPGQAPPPAEAPFAPWLHVMERLVEIKLLLERLLQQKERDDD